MLLMRGWSTGAMVIATGLLLAPGAHAAWFGFGNQPQQQGPGATRVQSATDTARLDQIEQTIRDLTGQVQTLQHQLDQLSQELQKAQSDNEYRFGQLEHGAGGGKKEAAASQAAPPPPAPAAHQSQWWFRSGSVSAVSRRIPRLFPKP